MSFFVRFRQLLMAATMVLLLSSASLVAEDLSELEMKRVLEYEQQRIDAIDRVLGSVVAIYGDDRAGGGSGVIIHPSGIVLTNHHVVMGAGVEGWGGISDGKLYKWKLIGTDPGGDVSIVQLEGRDDFPCTPLGDSDKVRVGDWALAMGNPFILSEDQSPTVTLGIVSGIKRYQPGAGQNQLEYGNCIQVDSSINPGNSGGPLFNFHGEVVGINGRGSFRDRGRVNVGLGYAISSNQIRNFIPELLATKLVEHATLDANFSRREDKVVCSQLDLDSAVAEAGLSLGDELLEFEGVEIKTSNQFTNLICTIPENWPVSLKVRGAEGKEKSICVRAFGLPYEKPKKRRSRGGKKSPEQEKAEKKQNAMVEMLSAPPGEVRFPEINQKYASLVLKDWRSSHVRDVGEDADEGAGGNADEGAGQGGAWELKSNVYRLADGKTTTGEEHLRIFRDGRFHFKLKFEDVEDEFVFDGRKFYRVTGDRCEAISQSEAKANQWLMSAYGVAASVGDKSMSALGEVMIDGSDKVDGGNAWRMRIVDADEGPTFAWIDFNRDYGRHELAGKLRKISAREDGEDPGAVLFADYQFHQELAIPHIRRFVIGLKEIGELRIELDECQFNENSDDSMFSKIQPEEPAQEMEATDSARPADFGEPAAVEPAQSEIENEGENKEEEEQS